jgi:hypothetical protein
MKNLRQQHGDFLRPEYRRSDFGEMTQGKYATTQIQFAELVRLLLACIGEDEGLEFTHHSTANSNAVTVANPQERSELQNLLLNHVRALKTRVEAL